MTEIWRDAGGRILYDICISIVVINMHNIPSRVRFVCLHVILFILRFEIVGINKLLKYLIVEKRSRGIRAEWGFEIGKTTTIELRIES